MKNLTVMAIINQARPTNEEIDNLSNDVYNKTDKGLVKTTFNSENLKNLFIKVGGFVLNCKDLEYIIKFTKTGRFSKETKGNLKEYFNEMTADINLKNLYRMLLNYDLKSKLDNLLIEDYKKEFTVDNINFNITYKVNAGGNVTSYVMIDELNKVKNLFENIERTRDGYYLKFYKTSNQEIFTKSKIHLEGNLKTQEIKKIMTIDTIKSLVLKYQLKGGDLSHFNYKLNQLLSIKGYYELSRFISFEDVLDNSEHVITRKIDTNTINLNNHVIKLINSQQHDDCINFIYGLNKKDLNKLSFDFISQNVKFNGKYDFYKEIFTMRGMVI